VKDEPGWQLARGASSFRAVLQLRRAALRETMISTMNPHARSCIGSALLGVVAIFCTRAEVSNRCLNEPVNTLSSARKVSVATDRNKRREQYDRATKWDQQ
jgi:hypothetical protein